MNNRPLSSHFLVVLQLIGICLAIWPSPPYHPVGFALTVPGGFLVLWVFWFNRPGNFSIYPEPLVASKLITTGPYRFLRHPMYTALVFIIIGFSLVNLQWHSLIGALLVIAVVSQKIPREENYLRELFPEYIEYEKNTWKLFPGIW